MKKIISFSLYGNKPNFQVGAVVNVLEAKRLYPDWKCRFYTTDDESICKQLEYLGAEIVRMDDHWMNQGYSYGSLWRFLAVDDADICIFRDTDSVVNERELEAVNEWLGTDNQWHVMHDHDHHKGSKIMAGMFGYRCCDTDHSNKHVFDFKNNDNMLGLIKDWLNGSTNRSKSFDQRFLGDVIHPKINNNVLSHGVYGKPFPEHAPCRYGNFIGDYSFWTGGWKEFVNGDIDVQEFYRNKKNITVAKEKSWKKGVAISCHKGLGDMICLNGAVRYFIKKNPHLDEIRLIGIGHNYEKLLHMYRDEPKIKIMTIEGSGLKPRNENKKVQWRNRYENEKENTDFPVITWGPISVKGEWSDRILYDEAGIPFEERWNSFYIKEDLEKEEQIYSKLNPNDEDFIFSFNIDPSLIQNDKNLKIIQSDPSVFIFHLRKILMKMSEFHCAGSSICCWVDSMDMHCKLYFHQEAFRQRYGFRQKKQDLKNDWIFV
jgi:hypothetical protein